MELLRFGLATEAVVDYRRAVNNNDAPVLTGVTRIVSVKDRTDKLHDVGAAGTRRLRMY